MDNVARGSRSNYLYYCLTEEQEMYYASPFIIEFFTYALAHCNHSKKKQILERRINGWKKFRQEFEKEHAWVTIDFEKEYKIIFTE